MDHYTIEGYHANGHPILATEYDTLSEAAHKARELEKLCRCFPCVFAWPDNDPDKAEEVINWRALVIPNLYGHKHKLTERYA